VIALPEGERERDAFRSVPERTDAVNAAAARLAALWLSLNPPELLTAYSKRGLI